MAKTETQPPITSPDAIKELARAEQKSGVVDPQTINSAAGADTPDAAADTAEPD